MGKLQDPSIVAGAPPQKAAEAAEEGAGVVELLHRMECRLVGIEALIGSTLGGVGVVAAGLLAIRKCRRAATARAAPRGRGQGSAGEEPVGIASRSTPGTVARM